MKANGDGKIEVGVAKMGEGWVVFQPGITPTTDRRQVPKALSEIMSGWLMQRANLHVRATLPIVEDGNTVAIHVWFEG
jgi:hypothetical protein